MAAISVTYSPAYTLVPTYECFNRCSYCNFRAEPGQDSWLSIGAAHERLQALQASGIVEILVLSGEVHPESFRRRQWLQHMESLCRLALDLGFLPHTNVGPLSWEEMAVLQPVNVSMGLMLEQLSPRLLEGVHRAAPSKRPRLRLAQLEQAGRLRIPFTTGLLLGIGETAAERIDSLRAIARLHQRWGHIQEVILQPYSPGQQQTSQPMGFPPDQLPRMVAIARDLLPPDITIQVPPNLIPSSDVLLACLQAGARDLGGIVPIDEVNPDYCHPPLDHLAATLEAHGWHLRPRLPIYAHYLDWLPSPLRGRAAQVLQQFQGSQAAPS
jgi:FO synthase subunit 1